jgi:hypothetical protein
MDNSDESTSFFKHVFNFDDDSKSEILNILQYSLIAVIPIVILNKTMQKYVPEADDKKSSLELSAEVIIQIIVMFIGLLLIHRIITYIPTYSDSKYPEFHIVYIVLAILMITMSLQTKLGEKVSILVDRVNELWNGKQETNKKGTVKVSQPISGQTITQPIMSQPMIDGTAISSLPTYDNTSSQQSGGSTQQLPNYDSMYRQDNTPLIGAATPGGGLSEGMTHFEPMAANAVLGGSGFGSW